MVRIVFSLFLVLSAGSLEAQNSTVDGTWSRRYVTPYLGWTEDTYRFQGHNFERSWATQDPNGSTAFQGRQSGGMVISDDVMTLLKTQQWDPKSQTWKLYSGASRVSVLPYVLKGERLFLQVYHREGSGQDLEGTWTCAYTDLETPLISTMVFTGHRFENRLDQVKPDGSRQAVHPPKTGRFQLEGGIMTREYDEMNYSDVLRVTLVDGRLALGPVGDPQSDGSLLKESP